MGEKRKRPSTAHARSQSTTKRLSITPAPAPPAVVTPPPPPEPAFPTSFDRDGPLPVLTECQPDDLPLKDFKSVAERCSPRRGNVTSFLSLTVMPL